MAIFRNPNSDADGSLLRLARPAAAVSPLLLRHDDAEELRASLRWLLSPRAKAKAAIFRLQPLPTLLLGRLR